MKTVLVTGAGSPGFKGIVQSLKNYNVIGVDSNPDVVGRFFVDKFYQVPKGDSRNFLPAIRKICQYENVDVILPKVTNELEALSWSRDDVGNTKVSITSTMGMLAANNKHLFLTHCLLYGISTPDYRLVKNYLTFLKEIKQMGYPAKPVCMKPIYGSGGRGFQILKGDDIIATKQFPEMIVMEYLPGKEYTVDVLADEGEVLSIVPRLRTKVKGGVSVYGETIEHENIITQCKILTESLKLNGAVGFQFKEDIYGTPKIIECNPRLQGGTVLTIKAGVNIPELAVKLALGEKVVVPQVKWGLKMYRHWQEIYE